MPAMFSKTAGPQVGQIVRYTPTAAGARQAAIVCAVNTDGTVNLAIFSTVGAASTATSVQYDETGVTKNPSWHWPEEYF